MAPRVKISKEELLDLYEKQGFTTFKIAEFLGCCQATIWKKLKEFDISSRLPGTPRVKISKEELKVLYLEKKFSTWKIEKEVGIPRGTVHRKLKEYGIKTRDLATANIRNMRKDFSEDLIEKAYLIGFRIGDLGVRKIWPNSKTITVASGSTIPEQIDLIDELFSKYGSTRRKTTKNKKINIWVGLNESFDFLLDKSIPEWVKESRETLFSFLAGFIDAEGWIGIYKKIARFSIGNYDYKLLFWIHNELNRNNIFCRKPTSDNRKGKNNSQGYQYNQNYWTLRVNKKEDLMKLFQSIKPYTKHKIKIKALNNAIENINQRDNKIYKRKMVKNKETFYVTTPIYYPTAKPHLGTAYTTLAADILARWNKLQGKEVFFLTGTDEHGQKLDEAAKKAGQSPKEYVDKLVKHFKKAWKELNIEFDGFVRTTDKNHELTVKKLVKAIDANGDLYEGEYEGLYCVPCESYFTEKDLNDGKCPICKRKVKPFKEKAYFFKLSKYEKKLLELFENNPKFTMPRSKRKEIIARIKQGLRDVSFTRSKFDWGVEFPLDKKYVLWVWADALANYLSGLGWPDGDNFKKYWPANVHLIGKDILWFHSVIWPAMLMSAGIEVPKTIFAHGWWTVDGEKMSKSKNNVVDPLKLIEKYNVDSFRYFLFRESSFGDDGDFSEKSLVERNNNELANKVGNLVSRVSSLAEKYGVLNASRAELPIDIRINNYKKFMEEFRLDRALNEAIVLADELNTYAQAEKPWELAEGDEERLKFNQKVLYRLVDGIRELSVLLSPFIPESAEKIAKIFESNNIKKAPVLFKKIETPKPNLNKSEEPKEIMEGVTTINFDDFEKINLRVAEIQTVEDIEGADKLYKLEVSIGEEVRTICAGIKQFYSHDDLKGKKIIVLTNLKPRKLRGIESQGMLLAASDKDHTKVSLISPDQDMEPGSIVG